jgi:hypothetical protein
VTGALELLGDRFGDVGQDGPSAYAAFLAEPGDDEAAARLRREAVATVRSFLGALHTALA